MTTSKPTNQSHIQRQLSLGDFLVPTSAWRGNKLELKKRQDQGFSTKLSDSFAWYDQSSLSWKTWQRSLVMGWESYLESWPRQGMTANGCAYELVMWEAPTAEIVGGLLPTPIASEAIEQKVKFKQGGTPLLAALLPTPTARDYKDSGPNMNYKKAAKKGRLPGVIVESRSNKTGNDTYLNPRFVEEMMGYPIGYTEVQD